ncbi:universal stress protein [Pseudomonas sp. GD03842]|uniref:universal stress protein n=1 Tax=Pseudomonas sp. GD03842 TaxID=2975385 RepID=UPI002448DC88|nr:universal stress protein [Pseudomonas sp. GD03842]MDH0747184.1 universal stress protein [Pseudomonas sp. GD03842]
MNESPRLLLIASSRMERTAAFERAVALARAGGMSLQIVALDYIRLLELLGLFSQDTVPTLRDGYLQTHRRWLEQEAAFEREQGLDCSVEVIWSDPTYQEIIDCVRRLQPAMLIKDVHHESTLKRLFSTPLDWHLIRDCKCPLQFVSPGPHRLPLKILAAVNLYRSEDIDLRLNDQILSAASSLAAMCQASLHVIYVYDWATIYAAGMPWLGSMPIETGFREALADAHEESFNLLCDGHGIDSRHRHFISGTPLSVVDGFARQDGFDLLVMGTLGRHDRVRSMGDTAEVLLGHAPCSMLIVKSPESPASINLV